MENLYLKNNNSNNYKPMIIVRLKIIIISKIVRNKNINTLNLLKKDKLLTNYMIIYPKIYNINQNHNNLQSM